jgi:SHS2 domain-containing protein
MTSSFRFLEDIALADSAFEARGGTPSELFAASARAVIETLADTRTVAPALTRTIIRSSPQLPDLLFDWLSDIVYLKDAEGLVFREAACAVSRGGRRVAPGGDPDRRGHRSRAARPAGRHQGHHEAPV